jgi:hypothetical protein
MSEQELEIVRYCIQKHGEQVQHLLNEYLIPISLKRMGLRADEVTERHYHVEDVLEPRGAFDIRFEGFSFVAIDGSSRVVGCQLNYFVDEKDFDDVFVKHNKILMSDESFRESVRKYCQHRYAVSLEIFNIYRRFNVKRLLYLETTCVHPDNRGANLFPLFIQASLDATLEGVLIEGQWSIKSFMRNNQSLDVIGDILPNGLIALKRILSYDRYVIPIYFRPAVVLQAKM